jgi:glycosyltransferase involved in cell wall biosynthesis
MPALESSRPNPVPANLPKVSVILPNYNHGKYLETCLNALVQQSVLPSEIVVIDDASTDDSVEIIERFARRHPIIRLHRNAKNQGVVPNMNLGLKLVRDDYVFFQAADDYVLPGFMEKSLALLSQYPEAALSCTISDWFEVETKLNWHMGVGMGTKPCFLAPTKIAELEHKGRLWIGSNTTIFRKEPLLKAGGFVEPLRWHCDWFAMTVIAYRHGICFVPEPLARLFVHKTGYYTARKKAEHREVLKGILDRLLSAEYQDVESPIRTSGALYHFGGPILSLILTRPEYRRFLTPAFLRKNVLHIFRVNAKKFTPQWVGNLYFRLAGYRAATPKAA